MSQRAEYMRAWRLKQKLAKAVEEAKTKQQLDRIEAKIEVIEQAVRELPPK